MIDSDEDWESRLINWLIDSVEDYQSWLID